MEMSVGQLSDNKNGFQLFQGEVTSVNMKTSTELQPHSGSTCVAEEPGNLVSWVMFDDGRSQVKHPSNCPYNTQCLPGFKGQDCVEIGTEIKSRYE